MKEVELKRVAGPFTDIPFDNFIQSPIGLVPKQSAPTLQTQVKAKYYDGESIYGQENMHNHRPEIPQATRLIFPQQGVIGRLKNIGL